MRFFISLLLLTALVGAPSARADHPKTSNLEVTLRLSDNTFCPGGRMWGREGRTEGRDDRIRATIYVKTAGRRRVRLRRNERMVVKCVDSRGRVVARTSYDLRGTFGTDYKKVKCMKVRPPKKPGKYTFKVSLGGTTRDKACFRVDYDKGACPRRRRHARRRKARRSRKGRLAGLEERLAAVLPPKPRPPRVGAYARNLDVTFRARWSCNESVADRARVTIRNTHERMPIPISGVGSRGLGGLTGWYMVAGDGALMPGETVTFEAYGKLASGSRDAAVWVLNLPAARDGSRLNVNCGPDWNDLTE